MSSGHQVESRAPLLDLSAEELLMTTRAVRKRLDFERPVAREVLRECVAVALQAPSGSNRWGMQFVIVTDPGQRRALGELYRASYEIYRSQPGVYIGSIDKGDPALNAQQQRTTQSADFLGEHMGDAPALLVACIPGRATEPLRATMMMGSVMPGVWSFMLAARLRGLGTSWSSVHLFKEQEAAELLGIPYDQITQVCLTPVAYTKGTSFKPALRPDPDEVIHWDRW